MLSELGFLFIHAMAEQELNCSFCGRSKDDVDILIAGATGHICNRCVSRQKPSFSKSSLKKMGRSRPWTSRCASPRNQNLSGRFRHWTGGRQAHLERSGVQPLQAPHPQGQRRFLRGGARQEQRHSRRRNRNGKNPACQNHRPCWTSPASRRHGFDRSGVRWRRCGKRAFAIASSGGLRRASCGTWHRVRRDRQDCPEERQPLHHPGCEWQRFSKPC